MWCFSSRVAKATPNWGARVVAPLTPISFYICPMRRRWLRCNRNRKNAAEAAGNSGYYIGANTVETWKPWLAMGLWVFVGVIFLNSIFFYDLPVLCIMARVSFVWGKWKGPTRWLSTRYLFARIYASYLISLLGLKVQWFKGLQIRPMLVLARRFSRYRLRKTCLLHDLDPGRSSFRATCCTQWVAPTRGETIGALMSLMFDLFR